MRYPPTQRRHFQFIADCLKKIKPYLSSTDYEKLVINFSLDLSRTNRGFNHGKFIKACAVEETAEICDVPGCSAEKGTCPLCKGVTHAKAA